ncbi:uncharacterized protein LOC142873313 [Microcebus murinus]|uniref:uncharacterized protein LOC142873313 n=1 Tax=Microcebus murinus TaxID=30608 RepID=UPI003F6CF431
MAVRPWSEPPSVSVLFARPLGRLSGPGRARSRQVQVRSPPGTREPKCLCRLGAEEGFWPRGSPGSGAGRLHHLGLGCEGENVVPSRHPPQGHPEPRGGVDKASASPGELGAWAGGRFQKGLPASLRASTQARRLCFQSGHASSSCSSLPCCPQSPPSRFPPPLSPRAPQNGRRSPPPFCSPSGRSLAGAEGGRPLPTRLPWAAWTEPSTSPSAGPRPSLGHGRPGLGSSRAWQGRLGVPAPHPAPPGPLTTPSLPAKCTELLRGHQSPEEPQSEPCSWRESSAMARASVDHSRNGVCPGGAGLPGGQQGQGCAGPTGRAVAPWPPLTPVLLACPGTSGLPCWARRSCRGHWGFWSGDGRCPAPGSGAGASWGRHRQESGAALRPSFPGLGPPRLQKTQKWGSSSLQPPPTAPLSLRDPDPQQEPLPSL